MAKEYKIEIVLDGNKSVLKDFNELESAYMKIYAQMQANKLETKLDEKTMKQNIADLRQLEAAAMKMGRTLKESTAGVPQQWEQINGQIYKVIQTTDAAGAAVKKYEAAVLPSQRAVVSGYNAVGNSINQLTREAPAFAVSASTGFLAISNNLPMLFDALGQAREQGKGVFKSLISGIFSMGTALSVGVTLLTVYGGSIVKWLSRPSAEAALKAAALKAEVDSLSNTFKAISKTAGEMGSKLAIAFGILTSSTSTLTTKSEVLKDINKDYDQYLKNLDIETVTLENQTEVYAKLEEYIFRVAIAKAATDAFKDLYAGIIEVEVGMTGFGDKILEVRGNIDSMFTPEGLAKVSELISKNYELADAYKFAASIAGTLNENVSPKDVIDKVKAHAGELKSLGDEYGKIAAKNAEVRTKADITYKAFDKIFNAGANSPLFNRLNKLSDSFKKFFGMAYGDGKSKGTAAKKPIDYKQFQGSLDEIIQMTSDIVDMKVDGTWIDVENGIRAADVALEAYLSTFKGYNQAAKDAAAANKKLDDENTVLFQKKAEVEANRQKGLLEFFNKFKINPAAFDQISDDSKKTIDGIIKDFDKGLITIEQASERMVSKGGGAIDVYGLAGFQGDLAKLKTELEKNRKEYEKNQKIIDKNQGADAAAARVKYENMMLNIRKRAAAKEVEFRDKAIEAELNARDEAGKELVRQGLATFEINAQAKKTAYEKESRDALDALKTQLAGADKIFQDLFTEENGLITYNEDDLLAAYGLNGGKYASQLDDFVSIMNTGNAKLKRIESSYLDDLKNLNLEFIQDYLTIYRDKNATELYEMEVNLEHQKIVSRDAAEVTFRETEKVVEKRRKKKKKQSDEELRTVLDGMRNELKANDIFYDAELKLATEADKRALIEAEKLGYNTKAIKLSIYNTERELAIAHEKEILSIREKYSALIDETNKKTLQEQINDWTAVIEAARDFANALINFARQQNQNTIDQLNVRLQNTEEQYSQTLNRISSLEDELEGKRSGRRDAVLQALELEREREIKLANEKIALADRIAKEERKIRKREQAAALAESIINGALAITNVLATTPPPLSFVLAGIMAATTAVQTATIASQKFAKGGFTGSGGQRDETGHKVAGVVHNDEWVAPKWMVESPKFGGMINQLENARTKGFANGGFTSPDFNSLSQSVSGNSTAKLESMIKSYMETNIQLANRPLFVSATEVQNVNTNSQRRKSSVTL